MKALLLISALFSGCALVGQASSDTLQISKDFKTILIFPENISESSIGNDFGFIVDLPKPEGGKFSGRIIKLYYDELAIEKENVTNYLVITDTGNVYDFVLELVTVPEKRHGTSLKKWPLPTLRENQLKKGTKNSGR